MVTEIELNSPLLLASTPITVAGVPILIVGSKKFNKIEKTMSTYNWACLFIGPGFVLTNIDKNLYPGATLKLRF